MTAIRVTLHCIGGGPNVASSFVFRGLSASVRASTRISNEGIYIPWYERMSMAHSTNFSSVIPNFTIGQSETITSLGGTTRTLCNQKTI